MAKGGYRGLSVRGAVYEEVEKLLDAHPELGYSSATDFFVKAAVDELARLRSSISRPIEAAPPPSPPAIVVEAPATSPPEETPPSPTRKRGRPPRGRAEEAAPDPDAKSSSSTSKAPDDVVPAPPSPPTRGRSFSSPERESPYAKKIRETLEAQGRGPQRTDDKALDVEGLRGWIETKVAGAKADGVTDLRKFVVNQVQVYHVLRSLPRPTDAEAERIFDEHLKGVVA